VLEIETTNKLINRNYSLFVVVYLFSLFISISFLLINLNYFNKNLLNSFVWNYDDYPGINNVPKVEGFGNHFFGDYLHLFTVGINPVGETIYWPYFPFADLISKPFVALDFMTSYSIYILIFLPICFINLLPLAKVIAKKDTFIFILFFVFCNLGTLYLLDRGNIQIVVTAFISLAIYFLLYKNSYKSFAVIIGLAASIKVWPLLFLIVLLRRKRIIPIFYGLSTFLLLSLMSTILLGVELKSIPSFFAKLIIPYMIEFNSFSGAFWHAGAKNSSVLALLFFLKQENVLSQPVNFILNNYSYIQVLIFILFLIFYLRCRFQNIVVELLIISCFLLLVPPAQYGYVTSLISALVPILILKSKDFSNICQIKLGRSWKILSLRPSDIIFILLGLILVSWPIRIHDVSGDARYPMDLNTILNPVGLLSIMFVGFYMLNSKFFRI
jgi:hypothetical protein